MQKQFLRRFHSPGSRTLNGSANSPRNSVSLLSSVPHLGAPSLVSAYDQKHVASIRDQLENNGVLKISLGFQDDDCRYLEKLVLSLHKYHGHGLPITHSASRGWFWDVRPVPSSLQMQNQARSETMENFPWHTDCSYERSPPRFFALQVLQPDRCGGGTLSVLKVDQALGLLSPSARAALAQPEYRFAVPPEFVKSDERLIVGSVLGTDGSSRSIQLRFREEIITPLTTDAEVALQELKTMLCMPEASAETLHLTPAFLPRGSIILMDNRRWLHARNQVQDPNRHLRRVRWDARPFLTGSL